MCHTYLCSVVVCL
uniref:Uncharacterized protein n=1 Tax=Anguilla anguilla TaxID=7936 RepID=A0A0E9RQQ6_ANGAN